MKAFDKLGWIVSAGLVGVLAGSGFQDSQSKLAVVDLQKVLETSQLNKSNTARLQALKKEREDLLIFMDTYKVATSEQILRMKELSLKEEKSPSELQELETIKADIIKTDQKYKTLVAKQNPTKDEETLLTEYQNRVRANQMTTQRLFDEFNKEWEDKIREQTQLVVDRGRQAVQDVAKASGYTVVYDVRFAPYGANDLTEASLKAMDARK